jgi:hypothetical protein
VPGKVITYSVETLYHFRCGMCARWWTIGDWARDINHMNCPHCGERQEVGSGKTDRVESQDFERRMDSC